MKLAIVLASALFALTAVAGEYSKPTSVYFQSAATWVPATKVCRDGNYLKHKTQATIDIEICGESDSGSNYNCKTVSKELLQPVVSTAYRCGAYSGSDDKTCTEWVPYTLNQASVKVLTYSSKKNANDGKGGTVTGSYTIPGCPVDRGAAE